MFTENDGRAGQGKVARGAIRMQTLRIPNTCMCSWTVVIPGPGLEAISELRYVSAMCSNRYEHERARTQQAVIRSA